MILHVAYVSERPSRWLAQHTGIPVVALPATVDFQGGQTLSQWFDGSLNDWWLLNDGVSEY